VSALRAFIRSHRLLALWLVFAALAMKALVPGGYMIAVHAKILTVEICGDGSGGSLTQQVSVPMKDDSAPGQSGHGKAEGACPYSALSHLSLAGTDPLLLAVALVYIVSLGFLPLAQRQHGQALYLRPPLRGPPTFA
jgi:hypothetical protein